MNVELNEFSDFSRTFSDMLHMKLKTLNIVLESHSDCQIQFENIILSLYFVSVSPILNKIRIRNHNKLFIPGQNFGFV